MNTKTLIAISVASGLAVAAPAMADHHGDHGKVHEWLDSYGFSHVTEVEWKSNGRVEAEGFARDGMLSEVVFNSNGEVDSEEHERYARDAWGLDLSQLQNAMEQGKEGGIKRFDEIDVSSRGTVEVDGYDDNDREIELALQLNDL